MSNTSTLPPISTVWHRLAAFLVDISLLFVFGHLLGFVLWRVFFEMGEYGRLVGLAIIWLYFGLMNSRLYDGQTFGKRFFNIAVRGSDGEPIGLGCSFARVALLSLPFILTGWDLALFQMPFFHWLRLTVVLGVTTSVVYTLLFNREAQQHLHDFLCETRVIHKQGHPRITQFPETPHRVALFALALAIAAMVPAYISLSVIPLEEIYGAPTASLEPLEQALREEEELYNVTIVVREFTNADDRDVELLRIWVIHRGFIVDRLEQALLVNQIAETALETVPDINRFEAMEVVVNFEFDIAVASRRQRLDNPPITINQWREEVAKSVEELEQAISEEE